MALDGFLLPIFARNGPGSPAEECAEIDAEDSFEGCWIYTARVCSLLKRSKAACRWFLPRSFPGTIRVTNLETSPNWLCFRTIATFLSSKRDAKRCLCTRVSTSQHVLAIRWLQGRFFQFTEFAAWIIDPSTPPRCQGVMSQQTM